MGKSAYQIPVIAILEQDKNRVLNDFVLEFQQPHNVLVRQRTRQPDFIHQVILCGIGVPFNIDACVEDGEKKTLLSALLGESYSHRKCTGYRVNDEHTRQQPRYR